MIHSIYFLKMIRKLVQHAGIGSKVILLWLLALSCLDSGWSNPIPDPDPEGGSLGGWSCDITNMHKKKSMPGQCYSYQQCQWKGIGDYDMEVVSCPTGRVFDENISECVSEKVLGFNFDKNRCESEKPSLKPNRKGIQAVQPSLKSNESVKTPEPPQKAEEPVAPGTPGTPAPGSKRRKSIKKPMSMAEMTALSEQTMERRIDVPTIPTEVNNLKIKDNSTLAVVPTADSSGVKQEATPMAVTPPDEKQPEAQPAPEEAESSSKIQGRSMAMPLAPISPVEPIDSNPKDAAPPKPRLLISMGPDVGNIKQPNFFKPFDNFPRNTKPPGKFSPKTRILSHEPLVKPKYVAANRRVGVKPKG